MLQPLTLTSLTAGQVAFRTESGKAVLVEVIASPVEGLTRSYNLVGRAWQINEDGSRYKDSSGTPVITPAKRRTITIEDNGPGLHDQLADVALALVQQFELHAQLREAFLQQATIIPLEIQDTI